MKAEHSQIRLDRIKESPSNPRKNFDLQELAELAKSIAEHGVLQPIVVRPRGSGAYEIVVGHRRFRATKLTAQPTIPAIIRELEDGEVLELQIIENNQRQDIDPLEEADAICELMSKHGRELADIAAKLGRPEQYIRRRLKLTGLVPELRQLLETERIGLGSAEALASLPIEMQEELSQSTISPDKTGFEDQPRKWSMSDVRWAIDRATRSLERAPWEMDEVFEDLPSCHGCAFRSGAQTSLPGLDDSGDRCLKSACFETKVEAKRAELEADLIAQGHKTWNKQQREELERSGIYALYFETTHSPWQLRDDKRTVRELAPDAPEYIQVCLAGGKLFARHWISKSDVLTHLKQHEIDAYYALKGENNPKELEADRIMREDLESRVASVCEWAGTQRLTEELLRGVVKAFVTETSNWELKRIASNLMAEDDPRSMEAYFADRIARGGAPDLFRLAVELTLTGDPTGYNINDQLVHWEGVMERVSTEPADADSSTAHEHQARLGDVPAKIVRKMTSALNKTEVVALATILGVDATGHKYEIEPRVDQALLGLEQNNENAAAE